MVTFAGELYSTEYLLKEVKVTVSSNDKRTFDIVVCGRVGGQARTGIGCVVVADRGRGELGRVD